MLLDLLMPGMSGLELLARSQEEPSLAPDHRALDDGPDHDRGRGHQAGASDYLTKPFAEQELELAIQNALEKQTLRDEIKTLQRRLDQYGGRRTASCSRARAWCASGRSRCRSRTPTRRC